MTRVIQRCSTCGLEHDEPVAECEACLGALRYWCRAHSGEIGWLEGLACRRCADEKARPAPRPRAVPVPAIVRAARSVRAPALPRRARTAVDERASASVRQTLLFSAILCAIGFAVFTARDALGGGEHLVPAVLRGAFGGGLLGCILAIPVSAVRLRLLAWLRR